MGWRRGGEDYYQKRKKSLITTCSRSSESLANNASHRNPYVAIPLKNQAIVLILYPSSCLEIKIVVWKCRYFGHVIRRSPTIFISIRSRMTFIIIGWDNDWRPRAEMFPVSYLRLMGFHVCFPHSFLLKWFWIQMDVMDGCEDEIELHMRSPRGQLQSLGKFRKQDPKTTISQSLFLRH